MNKKLYIFYHARCQDGEAAKSLAQLYLKDTLETLIIYVPLFTESKRYDKKDDILEQYNIERNMYAIFLDITPRFEWIGHFVKIFIIDHHEGFFNEFKTMEELMKITALIECTDNNLQRLIYDDEEIDFGTLNIDYSVVVVNDTKFNSELEYSSTVSERRQDSSKKLKFDETYLKGFRILYMYSTCKSGCTLAYDFFNILILPNFGDDIDEFLMSDSIKINLAGKIPCCPWRLFYIEDRDTWSLSLPFTEEVSNFLYENKDEPADFFERLTFGPSLWSKLEKAEDKLTVEMITKFIETEKIVLRKLKFSDLDLKCAFYKCDKYEEYKRRSSIGNELLKSTNQSLDVACIIFLDNKTSSYWVSARSSRENKYALHVAKYFGGSGHGSAAGFTVQKDNLFIKDLFLFPVTSKTRDITTNTDFTVNSRLKPRGKFIVFEGIDKSGKTSTAKNFSSVLPDTEYIKFPDRETEIGKIIDNCLRKKEKLDEAALKLLFIANRFERKSFIEKTLSEGKNIVCDRYYLSNIVYNNGKGWDDINKLKEDIDKRVEAEFIKYLPKPDIIFFLLAPNAKKNGDELYETEKILERVQDNYRKFIAVNETDCVDDFEERYNNAFTVNNIRRIRLDHSVINFVVIGSVEDGENFVDKKTADCLVAYHKKY